MHNLHRTRLEGDFDDGYDAADHDEAEFFEMEDDFEAEGEAEWGDESAAVTIAGSATSSVRLRFSRS